MGTEATFDTSLISELNSPDRKTWVASFFMDTLRTNDRNKILDYDPYWKKPGNFKRESMDYSRLELWWENYTTNDFSVYINNTVINLADYYKLAIKNIRKTSNGYKVAVKDVQEDFFRPGTKNYLSLDWSKTYNKEFFDLILVLDGDYMDIYLEDSKQKLCTLAAVDQAFVKQFNSLISTATYSPKELKAWPLRADGSMDYPPPPGAKIAYHPPAPNFSYTTTPISDCALIPTPREP